MLLFSPNYHFLSLDSFKGDLPRASYWPTDAIIGIPDKLASFYDIFLMI
jgi:hypothetical protein